MDRQLGILIMKNENDILEEYLRTIVSYYDTILVLDGSDNDEGKSICSRFPEVVFYEQDKNVLPYVTDSTTRGFLWEKAKEIVDNKKWVGILHPDEFPDNNVLDLLNFVDTNFPDSNSIEIRNRHFFLHTSQRETWNFQRGDLIVPRMKYFMGPGFPERRYFRFNKDLKFGTAHSVTVPAGADPCISIDNFAHNQYSFRSREQSLKRAKTRWESGWQLDDYCLVLETGDVFFDTLKYPEEYKQKYPIQYDRCWYNRDWAYVDKVS
jgi:hypothetical protein